MSPQPDGLSNGVKGVFSVAHLEHGETIEETGQAFIIGSRTVSCQVSMKFDGLFNGIESIFCMTQIRQGNAKKNLRESARETLKCVPQCFGDKVWCNYWGVTWFRASKIP